MNDFLRSRQSAEEVTLNAYHFGPYAASFTTSEDIPEILAFIQSKETLESSKRSAVYARDPHIVARNVAAGLFFKIERLASNEVELRTLGAAKKITAITGAYFLGLNQAGDQDQMPIEILQDQIPLLRCVSEVGTTLVIRANDCRNEHHNLPRGCFYRLLVTATTLNLFRIASRCGRKLHTDMVTANVQNRREMGQIISAITTPPLAWRLIERPSNELIKATSSTVNGDSNFFTNEKLYFACAPASPHLMASYLTEAYRSKYVTNSTGGIHSKVYIDISFNLEMTHFLAKVQGNIHIFNK